VGVVGEGERPNTKGNRQNAEGKTPNIQVETRLTDTAWRAAAAIVLTAMAGAMIPSSPSSPVSPALGPLVTAARLLADDGAAVADAQAHFEAAIAADPSSSQAWAGLALTQARLAFAADDRDDGGRYALARAAASRALALDDRAWMAHAALGYVHAGLDRDTPAAAGAFARAVATGAFDQRVFIDYACVLKDLGRADLSLATIEAALARAPRSAALRAHRGLYLHALRRYDEELPALLEAVATDPRSAEAYFHLGLGYARRQQYDASLSALKTAVSLSNGSREFRWWLGWVESEASRS
jgi:tetratricopeptide (TPR) repeat protein